MLTSLTQTLLLIAGVGLAAADESCVDDVCNAMTLLQTETSFASRTGDSATVPVLEMVHMSAKEHSKWPSWFEGLFFGLLSALSLPIGALLGIWMAPVDQVCVGKWLAFGAGALIYAVATDLFGEKLWQLSDNATYGHCDAICLTLFRLMTYQVACSFLGAVGYIVLSGYVGLDHTTDGDSSSSGQSIALSMWIGMMLDGIPEALMMGFMTKTGGLSFSLVISILVANFPEAFSGSSLLVEHKMPATKILGLWTTLFILTGLLAMCGGFLVEESQTYRTTLAEENVSAMLKGFTGGAMLAMAATAMLPTAFKTAGTSAGLYFVFGFAVSILITAVGFRFGGPQELLHRVALSNGEWLRVD